MKNCTLQQKRAVEVNYRRRKTDREFFEREMFLCCFFSFYSFLSPFSRFQKIFKLPTINFSKKRVHDRTNHKSTNIVFTAITILMFSSAFDEILFVTHRSHSIKLCRIDKTNVFRIKSCQLRTNLHIYSRLVKPTMHSFHPLCIIHVTI